MPGNAAYRQTERSGSARRWLVAGALLAALAGGGALALGGDDAGAAGRPGMRELGRLFGSVGDLQLVAHTSAEGDERSRDEGADFPSAPSQEGARVPDSSIRLEFGMKLDEADVPADAVDYEVRRQAIWLTGEVGSPDTRDRIELLARSVEGVRRVDNDIHLTSMPE